MSEESHSGDARNRRIETALSIVSISISLIAMVFTLVYNLSRGTVQPFSPSGYGIIRGIDRSASDHLLIPMEWENTGGRSVLVRHPRLILRELDSTGEETDTEYQFSLAGEYAEISTATLAEKYSLKRSFTLEPHSVSVRVLVFHTERWWDDRSDLFDFRFASGQRFRVYIAYQVDRGQERESVLFDLPIYGSADGLDRDRAKGYWWDFWTVSS